MYDLKEVNKTYVETYLANGGDTTKAKLAALDAHKVPEEDRAHVASQLSGSQNWDKISEIRIGTGKSVREKPRRHHKKTTPEFTLLPQDHTSILLAECAALAHEANEDVCPID